MPGKISMQMIADAAEVSKFAVSRALSGKSGVKPETRDKIIEAAMKLGYFTQHKKHSAAKEPNVRAYTNQTPKKVIAVVLPNIRSQSKENPYWGKILEGISTGVEQNGLSLILINEHLSETISAAINPQGLLGYITVGFTPTPMLLEIRQSGLPFVSLDHEDPLLPSDSLFLNNYDCVRRMTNQLIGLGHRSFQFVGDITLFRSYYDRWIGFTSILSENGIPLTQNPDLLKIFGSDPDATFDIVLQQLRILHDQNALPTAFVCMNDFLALNVVNALRDLGLKVPRDCSVTGFDDIVDSSPALTTVRGAKEVLGRRAVEILIRRTQNMADPYEKILVSGDIIIRESTGSPRA